MICFPQTPLFSIQSVRVVTCCQCLDLFWKIPWCHLPHPKVLYDLGSLKCTPTIQLKILYLKIKLLNLTVSKNNLLQSVSRSGGETKKSWDIAQRAKKVVSDSLGLVNFVIGLLNSVFNLPDGQVMFFWGIRITEELWNQFCSSKSFWG